MPKLTPQVIKERAQTLKSLYIKHKGNKSRIAKALGITPQAINERFKSPIGKQAESSLEDEIKQAAKKLGIDINWYLRRVREGVMKPKLHNVKKTPPDYSVRHKYLVTLGETLKYLKGTTITNEQKVQFFVGDKFSKFIKGIETNKVGSDV